jgi:hypothetical protein
MITPALLVSNDAGATWSTRPITGAPSGDQPFIAAVHPTNPDIVYVRTDNWALNEETELDDAYDGLFVTDDGGMTFREVLRKGGKLFGFALSPDGQTVLAGFGDPVQATRMVNFDELGIYRASTADHAFTQALNAPVSCLTWNANGLYACFDELVGHSADATIPPMVAGFSPILAYENVRGPLACNAEVCLPEWQEGREDVPSVCDRLGAECNVDPAANVIACSAPTGGAGGMAGAAGSGAAGSGAIAGSMSAGAPSGGSSPTAGMAGTMITAGAGGSTGGSGQAGAAPGNDGGTSSSCGCRSHHATGARSAAVALALLALLRLRRRAKPTHSD